MRGSMIALRIAQKRVKKLEEGIQEALDAPTLSVLRQTLKELIE
jgi:hypothetical protein